MQYTTIENVLLRIPTGIPKDFENRIIEANPEITEVEKSDAWLAKVLEIIEEASERIDAKLKRYKRIYHDGTQKFPDVTDDPPTPSIIRILCEFECAYSTGVFFAGVRRVRTTEDEQYLLKRIKERYDEINDGSVVIAIGGVEASSAYEPDYIDRDRGITQEGMSAFFSYETEEER